MNKNTPAADDVIDLKALFFSLLSRWKLILATTILGASAGLAYLHITPNTYAVDALIQVEDKKGVAASALLGDLGALGGVGGSPAATAESEILRSRSVLSRAINKLNLDLAITDNTSGLKNSILSFTHPHKIQLDYSESGVRFVEKQGSFFIQTFEIPASYIDKGLTLSFVDRNHFSLSHNGEELLKGKLNETNSVSNKSGQWKVHISSTSFFDHSFTLTKRSEPMALQALMSRYSVGEKGKNSGILSLSLQGADPKHIAKVLNEIINIYHENNILRKSLESQQTLKFLDRQLPELRQQLEQAEQKFNQFRESNNTVDVTQESQLLLKQNIDLDTKRFELQQKRAELAARYTDDFPLMVEINSQIAALENKSKQLSSTLTQLPEKQRQYLQLYRDVQVNTQLYTNLLNSYQQLKIAEAGEIGNVRIIDRAIEPVKPIKPKKAIVFALATLVGGFLGVLGALALNLLRAGIRSSKELEGYLDLPVYASIPRSNGQEPFIKNIKKRKSLPIVAVKDSEDLAVEALRSVRTAIHFALMNAKNNVILLSGAAPDMGKSFIAVNLATVFAQGGKRVLLIDADMRRGYLHKYFNQDTQPGLSNYLLNPAMSLENVMHISKVENLSFISRGANPPNPAELLDSTRFADFITAVTAQFDYVIIDTPPALAVTDPTILSRHAGINLLVARYGKSHIKEMELTVDRFKQAGSDITGLIFNDVQKEARGELYNYTYDYRSTKD